MPQYYKNGSCQKYIATLVIIAHWDIESEEKKMTHIFYFIAFLILMIMLISIHMLNDETLRIPKW